MSKAWIVIQSRPLCESKVAKNLRQQDTEYYFPQCFDHRLRRRLPLFRSYLFALVEPSDWSFVKSTRGVYQVLMSDSETPAQLCRSVIDQLKSRENKNGLIEVNKNPFEPGQKVRITSGPLIGQTAIYEGLTTKDRVVVLLSMLGVMSSAKLNRWNLEAA